MPNLPLRALMEMSRRAGNALRWLACQSAAELIVEDFMN